MICTSVIPCLSNGLAENNKIMSMYFLFFRLFWPFYKFGFFRKWGDKPYTIHNSTSPFNDSFHFRLIDLKIFRLQHITII